MHITGKATQMLLLLPNFVYPDTKTFAARQTFKLSAEDRVASESIDAQINVYRH